MSNKLVYFPCACQAALQELYLTLIIKTRPASKNTMLRLFVSILITDLSPAAYKRVEPIFFIIKPTRCSSSTSLSCHETLHVS